MIKKTLFMVVVLFVSLNAFSFSEVKCITGHWYITNKHYFCCGNTQGGWASSLWVENGAGEQHDYECKAAAGPTAFATHNCNEQTQVFEKTESVSQYCKGTDGHLADLK